jgi:hypothetical protein
VISPWSSAASVSAPPSAVDAPEADAPEADAPEADAADDLPPVAPVPGSEARPAWRADDDAPSVESTQVLPTSWEPPPAPAEQIRAGTSLEPVAGAPRTRLGEPEIELDDELEARASTAEQAVPWLIGFILLLAGMVIVLLALIFAGEESFGAGASPSPSNAAVVVVTGSPEPSATPAPATPSATEAATPEPTATPVPLPEYGPLEMVYQGRAAALAPIYLLRHDFTVEEEPATMAQDPALDVRRFAWAPDGTLGAGLLADVLVSIEPGAEKRRLGDGIMTITFGRDASTVYAVRVTQDGGNDVANVLAIDFASGDTTELAAISYPRPSIEAEAALEEAQFADDGGAVRLYWMEDEMLRLWALGAGSWTIDPDDGTVEELDDEDVPKLWSPRDEQRVTVGASEGTTTLTLVDEEGDTLASTTIEGRVSHLRWSPDGRAVAFTVGRSASGGGVVQNLFLWDLGDEQPPQQLTNTGAAFGAEWLGSIQRWRP